MYENLFWIKFFDETVYCNKCKRYIKIDGTDRHECYKKAIEYLKNLDCKFEVILYDECKPKKNFKWR